MTPATGGARAEDIVHYILEHAASLEEEFGERQGDSLPSSRSAGADPAADSAGGLAPLPADLYAVANAIDTPYNRCAATAAQG